MLWWVGVWWTGQALPIICFLGNTVAVFLLSPAFLCLLLGAGDSAVIDSPGSVFLGLSASEGDTQMKIQHMEGLGRGVPERGSEAEASSAKVMYGRLEGWPE